ncbi:hypothetical protein ACQKP8_02940 [Photobacterium alginatilyticum]|uniref:DUF333 domain-containing protein n=1 Tax=Photobacterium alginatilyticum TaxID=1775171 RepID=A0ABW9YKH8_9GAMM|nr:hypothetical protein [Photobacterium alginatilyticum]NBI54047.1 hypothetical protein [Photobacterium alginatilyticum]
MKWLISTSVALFLLSPHAIAAQSTEPNLKDIQQACKLKQVTHRCEVVNTEKNITGICIDAQWYGLICSERKNLSK